ncbi:phage minor head protein [Nocardia sp. NPDC050697]|uniref:phage minor head protein n=1 Tax=Nocardia sp. NPDC050697 TaxID=3155158 RepID=UPI0033F98C4F
MAQLDSRTKLRSAHRALTEGIRASEDWHDEYRRDKETFKRLLRLEARLELDVADYLRDFSLRAPAYVDWTHYGALVAAGSPLFNKDAAAWADERLDFERAVIDAITSLIALGGNAAELKYGINLGFTPLSQSVLEAARTQVARLVAGVTETSRDMIRTAIGQSIDLGESSDLAITRVQAVINNPVRAEMIAQTESVNAYQQGIYNFATETQAKTKTWDTISGACAVCAPLHGQTVDRDDTFSNGIKFPSAHPRCRCSVIYNY